MRLNKFMVRYIVSDEIVAGPGGRQTLVDDPSGNLVELFEQAVCDAK